MRTRTAKLPVPLEKEVQAAVVEYLRLTGHLPIRVNSGAMLGVASGNQKRRFVRFNSEPGCADVLCVLSDGTFAAFECKRPGWKFCPTDRHEAEQESFLAAVRKRGGVAGFVTGVEDVERLMANREGA